MTEQKKVIKGLIHCSEDRCKGCPYDQECELGDGFTALARDALALLKEQEFAEPDQAEHIVFGTNRKCSICGKYLFPTGKFCPHCRRSVKWDD